MSLFAKKSLGQNFLNSEHVIQRIADAGEIIPGEIVLEIGPGKGILTSALLTRGAKVIAVEKDNRLIPILSEKFSKEIKSGQLDLIHADVVESFESPKGSYKLIANIPYYITGEILRKFLSGANKPTLLVLMVQKEVANRMIARDAKESLLSLSVKVYGTPSLVMNVSRGNFFPIPNVDSAVIKISDIKNPFENAKEEEKFFDLIHAGFAHKRKKLISNLEKISDKEILKKIFEQLKLTENARAEDITLENWISIGKKLAK
jgi:16S rRNA (adenine1518-N6/adenine1519-N6)-dimethyltransferase